MKICVTGGTGFVGKGVIAYLLSRGYEINALVRSSSIEKLPVHDRLHPIIGDPLNSEDVAHAIEDCRAIVHLVGIRMKEIKKYGLSYEAVDYASAVATVEAAKRTGLSYVVLLSGADLGNSVYVKTKRKAEEVLMRSKLHWAILRPAFIVAKGQQWPVVMSPFLELLSYFPGRWGSIGKRAGNVSRLQLAKSIDWALQRPAEDHMLEVPQIRSVAKQMG